MTVTSAPRWPSDVASPYGAGWHWKGPGNWHEHDDAEHRHKDGDLPHLHKNFPHVTAGPVVAAFPRPRIIHLSATRLARNFKELEHRTDDATDIANQLRTQGYAVTVENVDEWVGPDNGT